MCFLEEKAFITEKKKKFLYSLWDKLLATSGIFRILSEVIDGVCRYEDGMKMEILPYTNKERFILRTG